jgi:hypothetical protein
MGVKVHAEGIDLIFADGYAGSHIMSTTTQQMTTPRVNDVHQGYSPNASSASLAHTVIINSYDKCRSVKFSANSGCHDADNTGMPFTARNNDAVIALPGMLVFY